MPEPGVVRAPRFADLGLPVPLVQALRRAGLETAFPIQAAAVPDILAGRDVLGRAATGSGKTLAFGLPMLVRLVRAASAPRRPRGLILAPTRELALQIETALDEPALALGLRLGTAVGGVPIARQAQRLDRGVDLLIATPGRLADLIAQGAAGLDAVRVVAVDEADHLAQLGFLDQITALLDLLPADSQHLLFSATLDDAVDVLVQRYLREPVLHAVDANTTGGPSDLVARQDDTESPALAGTGTNASAPPREVGSSPAITHHLLYLRKADKRTVVAEIAAREGRTLLFVRTQYGADKLARRLRESGIAAAVLHGGKAQNQRTRTLAAFADGSAPVLVATDVAARGIHVDDISLVVHVDPPADPKDYLHRAGRTARAGATGTVVTLVTEDERETAEHLVREAGIRPTHTKIRPGDRHLTDLTGARRPSGTPVPDPTAPAPPPSPRTEPGDHHRRSRTGRSYSTRRNRHTR
ncbi:DEAD/DEAH box helicase [Nocardia sp. CA2R105]|uniref:DEAD/DEAH box helicase n=1 Tax=Nocardia coffeae TaxID=2873381 RepID=UPI001CA62E68|nr:DEAD/DEAH box helicase [Nocardia coffeae]MBY8860571.1 DEAD/DEAH box helicase [Nocardia coffeae]